MHLSCFIKSYIYNVQIYISSTHTYFFVLTYPRILPVRIWPIRAVFNIEIPGGASSWLFKKKALFKNIQMKEEDKDSNKTNQSLFRMRDEKGLTEIRPIQST